MKSKGFWKTAGCGILAAALGMAAGCAIPINVGDESGAGGKDWDSIAGERVTEEEWAAAIDYTVFTNVTIEESYYGEDNEPIEAGEKHESTFTGKVTTKIQNKKCFFTGQVKKVLNGMVHIDEKGGRYVAEKNGVYYGYAYGWNSDDTVPMEGFEFETLGHNDYQQFIQNQLVSISNMEWHYVVAFYYSQFSYDEEMKSYKAEIFVEEDSVPLVMEIKFFDKKIIAIKYLLDNKPSMYINGSLFFKDYGTTTVTLPKEMLQKIEEEEKSLSDNP